MQASTVQAQSSASPVAGLSLVPDPQAATPTGPQLRSDPGTAPQAFFDAARQGDVGALATMLAEREARPTALEPRTGMTALMLAVLRGHARIVALLTDRRDAGAFINLRDAIGNSALSLARAAGHEAIVAMLEQAGARDAVLVSVAPALGASLVTTNAPSVSATTTQSAATTRSDATPATAASQLRPTTLLQAAEVGDVAVLREMLGTNHRELNRFSQTTRLLRRRDERGNLDFRCSDEVTDRYGWEAMVSTPLHVAAALGHGKCVDALIEAGADADLCDDFGPASAWAAWNGHAHAAARLGMSLVARSRTSVGSLGLTPMALAALRGHADVVRAWMQFFPNEVNKRCANSTQCNSHLAFGWTPLMYAAYGGHVGAMQELLRADPNALLGQAMYSPPYGNAWSVLMIAAFHGRAGAVRLLIERGAKVNYMVSNRSGGRDPNCALACAVMRGGDADTVRALLDGGAEISCYDAAMRNSTCLLAEAIEHGSPEMVPLLLRAGAKANWTSRSGDSLLVMAARDGGQAVNVARLVAQGARLELAAGKGKVAADEGRTPLMIAASAGNASMVQALIDAGAMVDQANALQRRMKRGGMGFSWAGLGFPGSGATASSTSGATTGSSSGGTTNFNPTGITGFSFGGMNEFTEPNPEHGCTAVICAIQAGHIDVARMLLRAGADVNAASADGRTVLMHALATRQIDIVPLLLQSGADPKRQSASGETAESIARKEKLEHLLGS